MWNTHNWMCHNELLGHGDEVWALAVVGDRLVSGSIDRYVLGVGLHMAVAFHVRHDDRCQYPCGLLLTCSGIACVIVHLKYILMLHV